MTQFLSLAKSASRAAPIRSVTEADSLRTLAAVCTTVVREVRRAKILLGYHACQNFSTLSRMLHVS